jgi:tetratricopeptide (TPR) repeat protein
MKAPMVLCLVFSLATAMAEKKPAENSDKSDDAKASAAFLAGDYDAAISLYTEVIKADPKAALAYNGRALAYRYKKDDARALADFDEAIRIKPFWMFFYNRGVTRYENGDNKSAIADLTRALRDKPGNPRTRADCLVTRARCYINQAKSAPALSDLNAAIKLNGQTPRRIACAVLFTRWPMSTTRAWPITKKPSHLIRKTPTPTARRRSCYRSAPRPSTETGPRLSVTP